MAEYEKSLRKLLTDELPLDGAGPHLRRAVRRALATGDEQQMLTAGRSIVGEMLRKGELLRLVMERPSGSGLDPVPLCLVRGTKHVLDLSPLRMATTEAESMVAANPGPDRLPALTVPPVAEMSDFADVLGAMEDAQDLDIGDPQSADKALVLAGILRLLGKFTPQFKLLIMVDAAESLPETPGAVFQVPEADAAGTWLEYRESGQAVWIPALSELPQPVLQQLDRDNGADGTGTSAVAVPLWEPDLAGNPTAEPREAGLMFVVTGGDWPRETLLRLAERLSRFVTRRWHRQHEVNQRIHTDSLTGVFNRAFFDTRFTLELERARRSEVPLTLVIADIDHFKKINDRLGHQCGDRTLQMVARRLQEELRRIDLICRIGGEEFALILPDTGQEPAQEVMGRLLDAPLHEDYETEAGTVSLDVTFSYGAVTFPGAGADAFELYRKADAMLYLSKDLGRNQCHFWNSRGDHLRITPSGSVKK